MDRRRVSTLLSTRLFNPLVKAATNAGLAVPGIAIYIPPGVAHGFCARSEFTLLYLVDRTYDGGIDEFGFSPLDPAAGIDWPVADPILSDRDRDAPGLEDALATAPVGPSTG